MINNIGERLEAHKLLNGTIFTRIKQTESNKDACISSMAQRDVEIDFYEQKRIKSNSRFL